MNTSVFTSVLNLDPQPVWRRYREHSSDFREQESTGDHYRHDLQLAGGDTVRVPIYESENFGKLMSTDEKQTGEEMHTIPGSRETGKTALTVRSMKYEDMEKLPDGERLHCRRAETPARDLSPLYAKAGNEQFFNTSAIAGRFHVIRSLTESCQDVRVRLRQDLLRDRRVKHTDHRKQEKERKKECRTLGKEYVIERFKYGEEKLSGGETVLEALARSRYLLFRYADDRTCSQSNRAYALFEKFPEIRKVYDRCREFGDWMKKENTG